MPRDLYVPYFSLNPCFYEVGSDELTDSFVGYCWELIGRSVHSDRYEALRCRIVRKSGCVDLSLMLHVLLPFVASRL